MRLRLEEGELRHLLQLQEAEGAAQGEAQVQPKQEEQGEAQEQAQRLQEVQAKTQARGSSSFMVPRCWHERHWMGSGNQKARAAAGPNFF